MSRKTLNLSRILFLLALTVATIWIIRRHNQPTHWQDNRGEIFGTYYRVQYAANEDLGKAFLAELQAVDNSLSMFNQLSLISRINRNETDTTDLRLRHVLQLSLDVWRATDVAFDVTVAPLVSAWGFGLQRADSVTPQLIDSLMQFVGSARLTLTPDGRIRKADPRLQMDFSAVAKGYGVDCVANVLERHGIKDYAVWIGGEMRMKGHNPEGKPWTIGIQNPKDDAASGKETMQTAVQLGDCGLATSGDYLRYYVKDGRKISHTIDPRTGYPAGQSLLSATVRTADCATADALATAFMTMGTEAALRYLDAHPEVAAYLICDENGRTVVHKRGEWVEAE